MHLPRPVVSALARPGYRLSLHPRQPIAVQRVLSDAFAALLRPPAGAHTEHVRLAGRPAERVTVGASHRPRVVLYLHGGGYTVGSPRMYRALTGHLARAAEAVVYSLDYRLAPEHPYPAALEDAVAAFTELVAEAGDPEQIALAGDSAGGGLALAAATVLLDRGMRPGALLLLSPWLDPDDTDMPVKDEVLRRDWGHRSGDHYRGDADPRDPGFAPMHTDVSTLAKLPPILIHAGAREMLLGQIRRFAELADDAGADVRLVELPGVWHSGHMLAGMLREATDAVTAAGSFLRRRLGP